MSSDLTNTLSSELAAAAWELIPGGINSARRRTNPPITVRSASGAYLVDVDGREILDYHQAYGAIILGHSHPAVVGRVTATLQKLDLLGLGVTEDEIELARRLVELIPCAEQVILNNSGSEATYNAIRLARAITGREKVLKFQGCYHGGHDYVLRNRHWRSPAEAEPEYGGVLAAASESVLVCNFNDLDDVKEAMEAYTEQVAAIIVEPIAHNAPNILPVPGFLEGLRELCNHHGSILIFDEVVTCFRHHVGGYQAICGVTPDLSTVGKALANGLPIAAVVGRRDLMERFATNPEGDVFLGGTYNGNAVVVSAALATLDVLTSENVHEHIYELGQRMRDGLTAIAVDLDTPAAITGYGSLYAMVFTDRPLRDVRDVVHADPNLFVRYREQLLSRNVLEMPVPYVRAQVGFAHTTADVDRTLELAAESLSAAITS